MMFSNSSLELNWPSAETGATTCWPSVAGCSPSAPVANCTFCPRILSATSAALMRNPRSLSGFSQIRMEYSAPNCCVWPTPGMREIGSSTWPATMLLSTSEGTLLSLDRRLTAMRKPEFTFATVKPCSTTSRGRRGSASATRFCVCTAATSGSVPVSNTSVMPPALFDELDEKYIRLSMPVSCCSITWMTVRSTVSAFAPG